MDATTRCHWIATHVLPYEGEIRSWLRRHVSSLSAADLDDVIQEAYARLWRTDFTTIANGRGYFYTIVRNVLLEQARRARIVPMERMGQIEWLRIASEDPDPEQRANVRQELERLVQILAALPAQWRRAFELQKFRGLSQREIAQEMGLAEKTIEKYLGLALARILEARVAGHGGTPHTRMRPEIGVAGNDHRETHD